jgi:thiol-disulfide isomerase/thioredoxin
MSTCAVPRILVCTLGLLGLLGIPVAASAARGSCGGKSARPPTIIPADSAAIKRALAIARARPGTKAVLVNVWATWCEPCREEMPDLVRMTRDPKAKGVRLMLISTDSAANAAAVGEYLAKLGLRQPSYLKTGDDMAFINGMDPDWDGTLPTSWLYDADGNRAHSWKGKISYPELLTQIEGLSSPKPPPAKSSRRKP